MQIKYIKKEPLIKQIKDNSMFIMFHGYGSNEKDLLFIYKDLPPNFLVLSIRGFYNVKNGGFSWFNFNYLNDQLLIDINQINNSQIIIIKFIKKMIKLYNIKKLWICGFSQGAILSYALSLNFPEIIKYVIILSGYPYNDILQKKNNNIKIQKLIFFISHGKKDPIIPIEWARKYIDIINFYKIQKYFYKEYESDHSINELNYKDLINWINNMNNIK